MLFPLQDTAGNVVNKDANSSINSGAPSLVTAGGTGDGTKVTGQSLDRRVGTAYANSCALATGWVAALTDTKTISFTVEYQDSADQSTWNTAVAVQAITVAQTATATTNYRGVVENLLDLTSLERYVRFNVTCTLSNTATDTASFHSIATFGGYDQTPQ
jgi:hypothetical protein